MWFDFIASTILFTVILYLPGFVFFIGCKASALKALILAPIFSISVYCILGVIFAMFFIESSTVVFFTTALLIGFVPNVIRFLNAAKAERCDGTLFALGWRDVVLYVVVGICAGTYMYLVPMGSPDAFIVEYDHAFHMNVVQAFLDSGSWSVLEVSKYLTPEDMAIEPLPGGGFYPAVWHILCAMTADACGCGVPFAINVVNFAISGIVFPTGMAILLSTLFKDRSVVRVGAFCTLAIAGFPWLMMLWGPLYANALAFTLIPHVSYVFIDFVRRLEEHWRIAFDTAALLMGVLVLAVSQTNSIFFCIVFLAPFVVQTLWTLKDPVKLNGFALRPHVLAVMFAVLTIIVWLGFAFAPFMREVVFYSGWGASTSLSSALIELVSMNFTFEFPQLGVYGYCPQVILAVFLIIGIACAVKDKRHMWLTVSYVIFGVIYIACLAGDGLVKNVLSGFWYSDSKRIAACLSIAAVPLVALGISRTGILILHRMPKGATGRRIVTSILSAVLCLLVYLPNIQIGSVNIQTALGQVRHGFHLSANHDHTLIVEDDEEEFMKQVKDIVGDELVVNIPDDGSIFAYPISGLRTYYRDYRVYQGSRLVHGDAPEEDPNSVLIRKYGAWQDSNPQVKEAFESIGARYVMVLDQGKSLRSQPKVTTYDMPLWTGLMGITDETPGFEAVLSDGDKRLYRVL